MAEWIQALRVAVTVTGMLLVVLFLTESIYKSAFFQGEVSMLKKCQSGFPPCQPIHKHEATKYEPPVIQTQLQGDVLTSWSWTLRQAPT